MASSEPRCASPLRRLLQFSLRTVLVLVTAFGVWLGLHVHAARKQRASVAAIEAKGGQVQYGFEAGRVDPFASEVAVRRSWQTTGAQGESWVPKWLLARFGEDLFHDVVVAVIRDSQLGDESLEVLSNLPRLESLSLEGNSITDKGLAFLADKTQLRELRLAQGTEISDAGLVRLARLNKLEQLDLSWSNVTNDGLGHLGNLKKLKLLVLHGSQVDDSSALRKALPGCRIVE